MEVDPAGLGELIARGIKAVPRPSAGQRAHISSLETLAVRLAEARLQVAALGQFKRGKSSLLNALLGQKVMPVEVLPSTSIPVFISGGPAADLRASFHDGAVEEHHPTTEEAFCSLLTGLVTEAGNPENRRGVSRVEARLPSALLEQGLVLIDTPGVGSTFRHNTAAAEATLPECDAALFVLSPDPPITEIERDWLKRAREATASLIVVLNKVDLLEPADREISRAFLERVLASETKRPAAEPLFLLSARQALRAKQAGDPDALAASGITALERHLTITLGGEKAAILRTAIAGKAAGLIGAIRLESEITLQSLRMPLEDLERRMDLFEQSMARIAEEQRDVRDRLAGDRLRLLEQLEAEASKVGEQARVTLLAELERLAETEPTETLGIALGERGAAFFDDAHAELSQRIEKSLGEIMHRHWQRADALAEEVRQTAAELFEIPAAPLLASQVPEAGERPSWAASGRTESLTQISIGMVSRFLPTALQRRRARRQAAVEVAALVTRNVESMRWAMHREIEEAVRRFATEIDRHLATALAATRDAMRIALESRRRHAESVDQRIVEEEATTRRLTRIEQALHALRAGAMGPNAQAPAMTM